MMNNVSNVSKEPGPVHPGDAADGDSPGRPHLSALMRMDSDLDMLEGLGGRRKWRKRDAMR